LAGLYVALMVAGCALIALLAMTLERAIPATANGVTAEPPATVS
jgi:hypothetical protein